jgi:signal transduction histidine kinase
MSQILKTCIFALLTAILPGTTTAEKVPLAALSLTELEQRLADIDSELGELASYSLWNGVGSLGYRSATHKKPDNKEWIRIELGEEHSIDQVVLLPILFRDSEKGLRSEGFPTAFRILAGTADTSHVVAAFTKEDHLLPRIAPLAVPFQPVKASWIRIEATTLSSRNIDKQYSLQLSEIMVFSGTENLSLQKNITVSSLARDYPGRDKHYLVDGFGPYLMDAAQGNQSMTKLISIRQMRPRPTLSIDLKAQYNINQINLHSADVSLSIPKHDFSNAAVPRHVRITGANRPDFTDQKELLIYQQHSIYETGPIMMRRFPKTQCRYVRIEILDPRPVASANEKTPRIAFSEIEILSEGRNVAEGAPVIASSNLSCPTVALSRITDGLNYYGHVLPTRDWMNQLARRHDLETERPLVIVELDIRHARQKTKLRRLAWLAALLGAGVIITVLIDRNIRQRVISRTRERIAANLHDELGANLHAIGLLGDLAKDEVDATGTRSELAELINIVDEIRTVTVKTGEAARTCSNMLGTAGVCEDLIAEMRQAAKLLLADLEHDFVIEDNASLKKLSRRANIDIYLFYKECLTNIIRHSGATRVSTRISSTKKEICLTVTDNGCGMDTTLGNEIPSSLKRRARFLKAKVHAESAPEGGTIITLRYRTWKLRFS